VSLIESLRPTLKQCREMALEPAAARDQETIGRRLRRLRLERGLSQRDLAAPGVSYAYISRIEAGARQPSVKALRRLAAKLGVSADYLETGADLPPAEDRELRLANLELAVRLGEGGDAQEPLEALLADAVAASDLRTALRARVSLALIAKERGEFARMVSLLQDAVEGRPFDPVHRVELYANLGYGYASTGHPEQAVALFERCLAASRVLGGAPTVEIRYATLLSDALGDSGDLTRAGDVIREALDRADGMSHPIVRVRLDWSLSRLAHAEHKFDLALEHARKAIALLDASEDTLNLARAHLCAAGIMITRRDADGAAHHLATAERLLGTAPPFAEAAMLAVKRAQVAALGGDGDRAVELAGAALETLRGELPAERGLALHALADGLALQQRHDEADATYAQAVEVLEQRRRWREATQAARAWARMLRAAGREPAALEVLERAAELGLRAMPADVRSDR
jgi:transcriptional regulator with XRE-family HTH domain